MVGIYLSGTGNTKHCIEKLLHSLDETAQTVPIENVNAEKVLEHHNFIILAYPVQFSNVPVMVRDFIRHHSELWKGKKSCVLPQWGCLAATGRAVPHGC